MIILKKFLLILIFGIFSFLNINTINAEDFCNANDVRVDYTYREDFSVLKDNKKLKDNEVFFHYFINVSNLNDKNYIIVKNDFNKKEKKITSSSFKSGTATYEWTIFNKEVEFTIDVYSEDENCSKTKLKTLTLKTPKLNKYYLDDQCREIPDFEMCQPFYETDIDYSDFYENVNIYRKQHKMKPVSEFDMTIRGKILDFLKNNICSTTVAIVLFIGVIAIIINKNRRNKK